MSCKICFAVIGLAVVSGSLALAQAGKEAPAKPKAPATKQIAPPAEMPAGFTPEQMQACIAAGTPGEMHKHLTDSVGVWSGPTSMWMAPGTPAVKGESTSTITEMMDGRFTKCEMSGNCEAMGPMSGFGLYGYDNVAQKFQSTWVDSMGTGMSIGTGELSSDGKTMTWTLTFNCPITKKPTVMREVERRTGKDSMTMEIYTTDPVSGKEFKMMEGKFTRSAAVTAAGEGH